MNKIIAKGYMTDGKGGQERLDVKLIYNAHSSNGHGYALRLAESSKSMGETREIGVYLTEEQWDELSAGMRALAAVVEENKSAE